MISNTPKPVEPKLPDGFQPRMLSFDVYGTLVNRLPASLGAFQGILADAGRSDLDAWAFCAFFLVANGMSTEDIIRDYPELTTEDIRQALQYASALANEEIGFFKSPVA